MNEFEKLLAELQDRIALNERVAEGAVEKGDKEVFMMSLRENNALKIAADALKLFA